MPLELCRGTKRDQCCAPVIKGERKLSSMTIGVNRQLSCAQRIHFCRLNPDLSCQLWAETRDSRGGERVSPTWASGRTLELMLVWG